MNYDKILIAVDGSPISINAAEKGIELSQQLNAEIALIYVVNTNLTVGTNETYVSPQTILQEYREEGKTLLDSLGKKIKGSVLKFLPEGHPAEEILKTAKDWNANLIVMGTHGRTGLKHLLMGSIAEHVVRHSEIPVMIVPAPNHSIR